MDKFLVKTVLLKLTNNTDTAYRNVCTVYKVCNAVLVEAANLRVETAVSKAKEKGHSQRDAQLRPTVSNSKQ